MKIRIRCLGNGAYSEMQEDQKTGGGVLSVMIDGVEQKLKSVDILPGRGDAWLIELEVES